MKVLFFFLLLLIFSCKAYWEKQEDYLLPSDCNLKRLESYESGISTTNNYLFDCTFLIDSLCRYPLNMMKSRGWILTKWHKPSKIEIENIYKFLTREKEFKYNSVNNILSILENKNVFISYIFDNDEPNFKQEKYSYYNWCDLYVLDNAQKRLVHFSYGKF